MPKTPTKAELAARLADLERQHLTRSLETVLDMRNEPASTLATLSADRVHAAIMAAEQGDTRDLFAIYRDVLIADTHLQSVIETRHLAVLGDDPVISPYRQEDAQDDVAAEAIRAAIERAPDFPGLCADLLWGNIWPLSIVERTYKETSEPGLMLDWADMVAVPDYLLRWTTGKLEIETCDPVTGHQTGRWQRPDPRRYITHRGHLMRKHPDNWGGPMRALVWWSFLKLQDREWWVRFLDRFGTPFPVAKFQKEDERSRQILQQALRLSSRIGGLVVTTATQVELVQAAPGAADAHGKFFDLCCDEQSKRVLGQTLSSTAKPTGLGSGTSDLQSQVRADFAQHDKKFLAKTLREQLFRPFLRINQIPGNPPHITFGGEEVEENLTTSEVLSNLKTAGLRLSQKSLNVLSKRLGLEIERDPEPVQPGSALLTTRKLSASAIPTAAEAALAADSISREAVAAISQAYRGSLAPVRDIILTSRSPEECLNRLLATFVDWSDTRAAEVVESAVVAGAFNGVEG